jgi:hypothetical protein
MGGEWMAVVDQAGPPGWQDRKRKPWLALY